MQTFILCAISLFIGIIAGAILQKNREINYKKHAEYYKSKCEDLNKALLAEIKGEGSDFTDFFKNATTLEPLPKTDLKEGANDEK